MERELIIKLNLDRSRAAQATQAFVAEEKRQIARSVAEVQQGEQMKVAAIQRGTQQARDTLGRFVKGAGDAQKELNRGWMNTESAIGGAAKALGSFAVQMLGIGSAQAVASTIVQQFRDIKREAMEAGKFVQGYRESLLELAALKGHLGQTTTEVREQLLFRAKTLQTAEAAKSFQEMALGAGESAIGVNISQDEFKKAMVLGGQFQAAEGGSAATHGRLTGMMPMLMGRKGITGAEAFAKEQQMFNIFQPGGGTFGQMTNQFLQQAPLVTSGLFKDPAQMAAILSAFSTMNPEGAGANVQQFTRATVGGLGRMRGANIEGRVEKQAEFLKRIGANDQMTPTEIGKLISAEFGREETRAAKAGTGEKFDLGAAITAGGGNLEKFTPEQRAKLTMGFNPMTFLQKHGYMNQEDMMALMGFHGLMKGGQFEGTFEPRAVAPPSADEAMKRITAARLDPVFQGRQRELGEQLAQVPKGLREEELKNALGPAFSTLKGQQKITGEYEDVMSGGILSNVKELIFGQRHMVELEAQRQLGEEATRLGIDPKLPFSLKQTATGMAPEPVYMGDERLVGLSRQIRAAGGNAQPGVATLATAADQALEQQTRILQGIHDEIKKQGERGANPPILGRPVVQTR